MDSQFTAKVLGALSIAKKDSLTNDAGKISELNKKK